MRPSQPVDFMAYQPRGRLVAAIEVKRKTNSTPEWATEIRDAMLGGDLLSDLPYFVLVAADRIYIWAAGGPPSTGPTHVLDTSVALEWYFRRIGVGAAEIHGLAFETLVGWWLSDLAAGEAKECDPQLVASGLAAALEGSELDRQDAA
jgi:hypothetical protein